jgi:16S rRNA (cytosine1402-N4)-methyltransferase
MLGIDRDPDARAAAASDSPSSRVASASWTRPSAELRDVVGEHADFVGGEPVVGVLDGPRGLLAPTGRASRGFSFRADAPLDMRMDPTRRARPRRSTSAHVDQHEFVRLLRENGESRFAGSIAKSVLERQPQTTNGTE